MAKLKLDTEEKENIRIRNNILKRQEETGITDTMMARELGINRETYLRKRNHPDRLKLTEYRYIVNRLKMPDAEIMEGIR